MRDVLTDLSHLLCPPPSLDDVPDDVQSEVLEDAERDRAEYRAGLDAALDAQEPGWDPVLSEINAARRAMVAAEQRMRLLIAYAREFVTPRGYRLEDLALAAGMSISGVRTSYGQDEIAEVATAIGAPPRPSRTAGQS